MTAEGEAGGDSPRRIEMSNLDKLAPDPALNSAQVAVPEGNAASVVSSSEVRVTSAPAKQEGVSAAQRSYADAQTRQESVTRAQHSHKEALNRLAQIWPAAPNVRRKLPRNLRTYVLAVCLSMGLLGVVGKLYPSAGNGSGSAVRENSGKSNNAGQEPGREHSSSDFGGKRFLPVKESEARRESRARGSRAASRARRAREGKSPAEGRTLYLSDSAQSKSPTKETKSALATGTTIRAVLAGPIELTSGTSTAVARVTDGSEIPSGARFIGSASPTADDRVSFRFERLVLANGREIKVSAEAQDEHGGFGLAADVIEKGAQEDGKSAVREAAKDTAADTALDFIPGVTAARAARNLLRASSTTSTRKWGVSHGRTLALRAGSKLLVFLHEKVELPP